MTASREKKLEEHVQRIALFCEMQHIPHGKDALKEAGFPYPWYRKAMKHAYQNNVSLALRVGTPPRIDQGYRWAGKPLSVKTKMSTLPFVFSTIPEDQAAFGKTSYLSVMPEDDEPLFYAQLPIKARSIIEEADSIEKKDCYLEFTSGSIPNIFFRIDLRQGMSPLPNSVDSTKAYPWSKKSPLALHKIKNGAVLPTNFIDEIENDFLFSLEYKKNIYKKFIPLNVLVSADGSVITGDIDILWAAIPDTGAEIRKFITNHSNDKRELYLRVSKNISDSFEKYISQAGIVTEHEVQLTREIEKDPSDVEITNLILHGAENHNPGTPSVIGKVLHCHLGIPILTRTECECAAFVLVPGYLENFTFDVHPKWSMVIWGPVIVRQKELGYAIPDETWNAYKMYTNVEDFDEVGLLDPETAVFVDNTPSQQEELSIKIRVFGFFQAMSKKICGVNEPDDQQNFYPFKK